MENSNHPLVSVFVVTYNAGEYICETLDSIKAQTYDNIELIVSDDHSSDETVRIANEWIEKNKERFVRTEVITIDHNTGVSANYNRAVRACRGEWVKNVDGDDLIYENCVELNVDFVCKNSNAKLVFSNVLIFSGDTSRRRDYGCFFNDEKKKFFLMDADGQFKKLLGTNILPSQTAFIKTEVLKAHPYNEKYRGLEDAPMWIYLTRDGVKAYYFDVCTAMYRRAESMTSSKSKFFSSIYLESCQNFFWQEKIGYIKENMSTEAYDSSRKELFIMEFAEVFLGNKRTMINRVIFKIASFLIMRCAKFNM